MQILSTELLNITNQIYDNKFINGMINNFLLCWTSDAIRVHSSQYLSIKKFHINLFDITLKTHNQSTHGSQAHAVIVSSPLLSEPSVLVEQYKLSSLIFQLWHKIGNYD